MLRAKLCAVELGHRAKLTRTLLAPTDWATAILAQEFLAGAFLGACHIGPSSLCLSIGGHLLIDICIVAPPFLLPQVCAKRFRIKMGVRLAGDVSSPAPEGELCNQFPCPRLAVHVYLAPIHSSYI